MTTFAEALHQDIPSILVVDRESSVLMQEMNHIESMMVEAGLLHFDPLEAASFVNEVSSRIDSWWSSSQVVNVKNILKSQVYYCDAQLEHKWSQFLLDVK